MDRSRWPTIATIAGLGAVLAALALLLLQIEVTSSNAGPARACGSAFDAAVDRSGWATWWDQDLRDPHAGNREALVRTTSCPSAVNGRLAVSSVLGATGLAAVTVGLMARPSRWAASPASARLRFIGGATAATGAGLTLAGSVAVVFLVADADSTLFLYTDRVVVALAGVVVLVPAVALAAGGVALRAIGDLLAGRNER